MVDVYQITSSKEKINYSLFLTRNEQAGDLNFRFSDSTPEHMEMAPSVYLQLAQSQSPLD